MKGIWSVKNGVPGVYKRPEYEDPADIDAKLRNLDLARDDLISVYHERLMDVLRDLAETKKTGERK